MPSGLTDHETATHFGAMTIDELCARHRELLLRLRDVDHWLRLINARLDLAVAAVADLPEPNPEPAPLVPALAAALGGPGAIRRAITATGAGVDVPFDVHPFDVHPFDVPFDGPFEGARPGAQFEGTRPGAQFEGTRPGTQFEGTRPGTQFEGTRPGAQFDDEFDGARPGGDSSGGSGGGLMPGREGQGTATIPVITPPEGLRDLLGIPRSEERLPETTLLPRLREAMAQLTAYGDALRALTDEAAHVIAIRFGAAKLPA